MSELIRVYDDELLWRMLVYDGILLRKRDERVAEWNQVCKKMLIDIQEMFPQA